MFGPILVWDFILNYETTELKIDDYVQSIFIHPYFTHIVIDDEVGDVITTSDVLPNTGSKNLVTFSPLDIN